MMRLGPRDRKRLQAAARVHHHGAHAATRV